MKLPFQSVRARLLLTALLVEALMLTILVSNSMRLVHDYMSEQLAEHAQQVTPILTAAIVAPLVQSDYATVQAVLTESQHGEGIKYLVVTNMAGRRIAQVGWPNDQAIPLPDPDIAKVNLLSTTEYHISQPIAMFGQQLGTLHFGLDLTHILLAQNTLLSQGAFIAMSEILLSFLILSGLVWWITRNLENLTRASHQVARGNFSPMLVKEGDDEFGQLGAAFNAMSRKINERLAELIEAKNIADEAEQLWSFALEGAGDAVWDWNLESNQVVLSKAGKAMFGFIADEVSSDLAVWIARVHPDDFFAWSEQWRLFFIQRQEKIAVQYRVRCKDGQWIWLQTRGMVVQRNVHGHVIRMIGTHSDISGLKQMEEQVRQLAFYDPLTKLPNRRLLNDRLEQTIAASKRSGCYGAMMFLDLDNFKPLNDTHGHEVGDQLLVEAANRIKSCVRETDTVARFGGDEFIVMLSELNADKTTSISQAQQRAEKILSILSAPYMLAAQNVEQSTALIEHHCTASIGFVLFTGHAVNNTHEIMEQADQAMYQAKNAGRNTVRFYDESTQAKLLARTKLEHDLRHALAQQQLVLYYQVQVNEHYQPIGAEVLLRWIHPQLGMLPPIQFIPIAEETGLIVSIGYWVLQQTCSQLKQWENDVAKRELVLAVNVSVRQFLEPDFVDKVRQMVNDNCIRPCCLKLEITESMLIHDVEAITATMEQLKEIGLKFSLDDFGTGYSSLSNIKLLPLDQLKIDRSFVHDIARDSHNKAIVQTIIAMAESMKLNIIAEGVETEVQRSFLATYGCANYQGYLFGKPVPLSEFEAQLLRPALTK